MVITPAELIGALFSLPLFSLVLAVLVALAISLSRRTAPVEVPLRYVVEDRVLGIVALGVILIFGIENIVRGYLLRLVDVVDWWRYPTPLLAAAVGLAIVLLLIVTRGTTPPEEPVPPTARRGWTTFGPRGGIIATVVVMVALLATTVGAGLASSSDEDGRFIYLELFAPNASIGPLRPWFYGWSYGIPVIISVVLLAVVAWAVLSRNSARPYIRPDLVASEQDARARVATAAVSIASAGILLALGGAFRFIARSDISRVTIADDGTYELAWRYAALATAAGWVAPILEIVGFTLLLLVAVRARRVRALQPELVDAR